MIVEAIAIFISQFLLIFFRLLNVRATAQRHVLKSVMLTALIQVAWLISSALGIKGFLDSDYKLIACYVLGGMLGSYFNFKIKM